MCVLRWSNFTFELIAGILDGKGYLNVITLLLCFPRPLLFSSSSSSSVLLEDQLESCLIEGEDSITGLKDDSKWAQVDTKVDLFIQTRAALLDRSYEVRMDDHRNW